MLTVKIEYDERQFVDAAMRAAMDAVASNVQEQVGSLYCEVHRQTPTIRLKGRALDSLEFEVEACCQPIMDEVNARLA